MFIVQDVKIPLNVPRTRLYMLDNVEQNMNYFQYFYDIANMKIGNSNCTVNNLFMINGIPFNNDDYCAEVYFISKIIIK